MPEYVITLFQVGISVNMLGIRNVSWLTADIHRLISCLSIVYIDHLFFGPNCTFTYSPVSDLSKSPVSVVTAEISAALTTDTVAALLSDLEVDTLSLFSELQVLDTSRSISPLLEQGQTDVNIYTYF